MTSPTSTVYKAVHHGVHHGVVSTIYLSVGSCRITLLPLQSIRDLAKKAKYNQFFNIAYFSNR